jgi:thymidylate synthase (FAD)
MTTHLQQNESTMRIELLDHGHATLIESWGSDERIIESARMSSGKGFLGWGPFSTDEPCPGMTTARCVDGIIDGGEDCRSNGMKHKACNGTGKVQRAGDEKLLRYLWENKHATPFEMAGLTVEIQAPIFVFRQWHRHRTQSYNEMSARYTPLPDLDYVPTVERLMAEASRNKQAGKADGAAELTTEFAEVFRDTIVRTYRNAQEVYEVALRGGVPKEIARVHLPVARYSRMRASANLRNWLAFLTLRMDAHAQYEIRVYADAVGKMVADRFPRTWELFAEGLR